MCHAEQTAAKTVCHPDVALAVDGQSAAVEPDLEVLGFARVGGRETRDVIDAAVRHPYPVLLIYGQMEWCRERLARLRRISLANNPAFRQIAVGEMNQLPLLDTENPNVAAGRDDNPLHQSKTTIEGD